MATEDKMASEDREIKLSKSSSTSEAEAQSGELKNLNYEMLLIGFSILSMVNIALLVISRDPVIEAVIDIINYPLTVIFFVDFIIRFRSAESKRRYFFREYGWADLAASLPFPAFKILRLFRILRALRMIRRYGPRNLMRQINEHRADAALAVIAFLIICVLEFGGLLVTLAERTNPDSNIKTASDAIWWAFVTITTVGYGDRFPTTNWGRGVGFIVMMTGVGLFGVLTGYLANAFLTPTKKDEVEEENEEGLRKTEQAQHAPLDSQAMFAELKQLISEQEKAQAQGQLDSQAMLAEMKRLLSEQEKSHEELRSTLAELKPLAR